MIYLVSILLFLSITFLSLSILVYARDRLDPATRRLLRLDETSREVLLERLRRQEGGMGERAKRLDVLKRKWMTILSSLSGRSADGFSQADRIRFFRAGIRGSDQMKFYLGIRTLLSAAIPSLYLGYGLIRGHDSRTLIFLGIFSFVTGRFLFNLLLASKIKKRNHAISRNIHDAIDLLMICLEAGLGLNVALLKVGENLRLINGVLAEEFILLNHEIQAGSTRVEAYRNLRARTSVRELRSLMTMLIQSEALGASLGQVLRAYSDTLRTKIRQKAEERANKAGVKLAIPLVLFIFPPLFVVVLGPAVLQALKMLKEFIQ